MKIKINLVTLGNLKHAINFHEIADWQSKVFHVEHDNQVQIIPNASGSDWSYPDKQLSDLLHSSNNHDFTVGIINAPLEGNYYLRRLGGNVVVLSLYETAEILQHANFSLEGFIVKNLYEICLVYFEYGRNIPESVYSIAHDEIRGCLFDMNANKADIVFSSNRPKICTQCKARIIQREIPKDLISDIETELLKIKKPLYYRLVDKIRVYPVQALALSSIIAIIINVIASAIYDVAKNVFLKK